MKLLLAGNLANYSYYLTKLLRAHGMNAELLMQKYPSESSDPKTLDSNMTDYPSWIKFWNNHNKSWKIQIIKIMRKYDLIQASTELPIFSLFSGKPYIAFPTGSDITRLVFEKSLKGILLNMAYKKAKLIIYPGVYMHPMIEKLHLKNAIFIPPPWNYEKFSPRENIKTNEKLVIFHPTAHNWKQKGNDRFLNAFVKLCHERDDVHLIIINRGDDFKKSTELLKDTHCDGKFEILNSTVNQDELPELYNKADVVVDAFIDGSTGLIGQEAMSCGKPLIQYTDEDLYLKLYGEIPPIVNAKNENDVYNALKNLIENRDAANKVGKKSREWLLKHHDPEKIMRKYLFIYEAIKENKDIQFIKEGIKSIT